jgi:hypothetical protein
MTASVTAIRTESPRTAIERVDESTTADGASVTVVIHWDGSDHVGEAIGSAASGHRAVLVAQATLMALADAGSKEFDVVEATTTNAGGATVALVAVADPDLTMPLIGTAVMPDDNAQLGFAKATLDAVNRRAELRH